MKKLLTLTMGVATCAAAFAAPALAQTKTKGSIELEDYVLGNTLITLYHELAHAFVEQYGLPVLGREEDAADSFAIVELISQIRNNETDADTDTRLAAYAKFSADQWAKSAQERGTNFDDSDYFGEHALDRQRMFNTICLLKGGLPESFSNIESDLGVSSGYFQDCATYYDRAYDGWVYTLDTFGAFERNADPDHEDLVIVFEDAGGTNERWKDMISDWEGIDEVQRHISTTFDLDSSIRVTFKVCGQENAFYYAEGNYIEMCYELMGAYARYFNAN